MAIVSTLVFLGVAKIYTQACTIVAIIGALIAALTAFITLKRANTSRRALDDLKQEHAATLERLEALSKVRRDFVANVSHELRTPLTIVGGFAETLADEDVPEEQQREFIHTILINTRRMQRIVDELLDLSRIESGGWMPRPTDTDIKTAASDVISTAQPMADKKGVALKMDISSDTDTVFADRTALRQVLTNLVENAIRHTDSGNVTVFTERDDKGTWVGVRDTGDGISGEHLSRIFERFYRVDTGRSREVGGTGLGLAIVRHLVEAHGGKVSAESKVDSGTTIRALFPNQPSIS